MILLLPPLQVLKRDRRVKKECGNWVREQSSPSLLSSSILSVRLFTLSFFLPLLVPFNRFDQNENERKKRLFVPPSHSFLRSIVCLGVIRKPRIRNEEVRKNGGEKDVGRERRKRVRREKNNWGERRKSSPIYAFEWAERWKNDERRKELRERKAMAINEGVWEERRERKSNEKERRKREREMQGNERERESKRAPFSLQLISQWQCNFTCYFKCIVDCFNCSLFSFPHFSFSYLFLCSFSPQHFSLSVSILLPSSFVPFLLSTR